MSYDAWKLRNEHDEAEREDHRNQRLQDEQDRREFEADQDDFEASSRRRRA